MRSEHKQAQEELFQAEADLVDEKADLKEFQNLYQAQLGHLIDRLAVLEAEVRDYKVKIQRLRNVQTLGADHIPVEEQFRRTWHVPASASTRKRDKHLTPADEKQVKRLYRQLARRYHPDLVADPAERAYRTEKMAAVNEAYAARSIPELVALGQEPERPQAVTYDWGQTEAQMIEVLEADLARIRRRMLQIHYESSNLDDDTLAQLSLDVKFAKRDGRDLLAEMASDLQRQIDRKSAELDFLRGQFNQLDGPG